MHPSKLLHPLPLAALLLIQTLPSQSQAQPAHSFDAAARQTASLSVALQQEVHADMNFLADDELHGRGSATRDEHIAALFVASQLQSLGLDPGGDNGTFLQKSPSPILYQQEPSSASQSFRTSPAKRPGTPSPSCAEPPHLTRSSSSPHTSITSASVPPTQPATPTTTEPTTTHPAPPPC
ncbi:hypothetical protein RBB78_11890 [Tunturiibacter empetritectus]|uniref:hypothetical protein n=1 Tax=Tunturiibacter empetritectus TaxID=3069691 RepID=UPI003D9B8204